MTPTPAASDTLDHPLPPTIAGPANPWLFAYLVAITAAVPLESFLITLAARAHTPTPVLFGMQFAIEASVYLMLAWVVAARLFWHRHVVRTPIDAPLLVILAVTALTVAINNAPLVGSAMNLRSALRYAAVFYLVVNLGLTRRQVRTVLHVILICGALQVIAGLVQWVVGYPLKVWMLPHTIDIEVAGKSRNFALVKRGREIGSLFGTLGDTLYYGLFLVVILAVAMPRVRWSRPWLVACMPLLLLTIAYSYSRAAVIVTGMTVAVYLAHRFGLRRVTALGCAAVALGALVLGGSMLMETRSGTYKHPRIGRRSIVTNMTNIFSAEYLERSKRQRLGTVLGVAPTTLINAPLIGYGPDQEHVVRQLNKEPKTRLYKTLSTAGFEDVYWVALLCYTGILGVLAVFWLVARMAWTCALIAWTGPSGSTLRWAGLAGLTIVLQAAVLMWFNRVPEIRAFSFYLWLLPALAYAAAAARPDDLDEPTPPVSPAQA